MEVDILTIAAHPDDVEITCGGTVIKMTEAGYRVGILDLTCGRKRHAWKCGFARKGSSPRPRRCWEWCNRENLGIPDAGLKTIGKTSSRSHRRFVT